MRGGPDPYMRVSGWILRWYWQQWPTMWTSASAVDKEIPVGVFISCVQLARKYQTARKYQGIYFMSGNDEGQISDCALVYRDHRDVHRTTRQTHSDVYIRIHVYIYVYTYTCKHVYIYTRIRVMYTRVHTAAFQSPTPTCSIYGISLFLTNLLIHSVCLLFKQTN